MAAQNSKLKAEWDAIDSAEGRLDHRKWALAARLAKANDEGQTFADLATEVERSEQTVGEWARAHREFPGAGPGRPATFAQALEQLRGRTPEGERKRKDATAAKSVLRDPEQRAKLVESLDADTLDEVQAKVYAEQDKRIAADPRNAAVTKKLKREYDDPKAALAHTYRAFQNLGARVHLYGDVPLQSGSGFDHEEFTLLGYIRQIADALIAGGELDAELAELLDQESVK